MSVKNEYKIAWGDGKLLALEMDYLRRSAKVSRLQTNPKHNHQEQNANRTINFSQNSKKGIEIVWMSP